MENAWTNKLTEEQARYIKKLRVTGYLKDGMLYSCSWRAVATKFAKKYPELEVRSGNQIEGHELCDAAITFLGENYKDGWN